MLFGAVGSHLAPVALAIRYWNHEDRIDEAFAWMSDNLDDLDDQEMQNLLAHYRPDENLRG